MKKKLSIILLVVMVLTFVFVGCDKPNNDKNLNNDRVFTSKNDLMTVSAVSVGNMMGTYGNGTALVAAEIKPEEATKQDPVDPTITKINYYMSVVDGILGKNVNSEITDIASDDPEYGGKYTKKNVITTGADNNKETYTMIYNEKLLSSEEENKEDDENEVEEEFEIEGILIVDNVKYLFDGKRETETETEEGEDPETEAEFKFTAYVAVEAADGTLTKDTQNYINFKQEIETEGEEVEQEFKYEVYKNGKNVKAFSLEIERDPVDNELEVELVDGDLQLKFESEVKNGKEFIEIYAIENGEEFVVEAEVITNEKGDKVYKYSQEGKEDIELDDDFDDNEED